MAPVGEIPPWPHQTDVSNLHPILLGLVALVILSQKTRLLMLFFIPPFFISTKLFLLQSFTAPGIFAED